MTRTGSATVWKKNMCGYLRSTWPYKNKRKGQLQYDMVVPTLVCSTNKSKREYQKCWNCEGQQGQVDLALCLAFEAPFTSKWNLRDCIQDTIRALGYEKGDDVAKRGMEFGGCEIGSFPALGDDPLVTTEPDAVVPRELQ